MWYKEKFGSGHWFFIRHPSGVPYAIVADNSSLFFGSASRTYPPSSDGNLKKVSGPGNFKMQDSKDKRKVVKRAFIAWTAKAHI